VNDLIADAATDPFDPTETSLEAFLAVHGIEYDQDGNAVLCKCGWSEDNGVPLAAHLFDASRSTMYRESAAILQAERASAAENFTEGLHYGFGLMLARADAAELPDPGVTIVQASTSSV
jgi:hypothetical protein